MKTLHNMIKQTAFIALATITTSAYAANTDDNQYESVSTTIKADHYDAFDVRVVGEGKPVLLIPGLSSSASVWDSTVSTLATDYQVHVFHLAGFAGVPAASYDKVGASFLRFQKQSIKDYIAQQQLEDVVVIGHSLGGFLSLWLASEQADNITAVVNVDGLPALGALFAQRPQNGDDKQVPQNFDPVVIAKSMANNAEWHDKIVSDMMRSDPMTSGRAMGELMQLDIRDELANITIPTLTLGAPAQGMPYATYEQSQSNYERQFAALPLEFNHMVFAKTSKHFIMADEPQWLNREITEFLSQFH